MSEPPGDFLDVDPVVRQERGVGMPEVVDPDPRKTGESCAVPIEFIERSVSEKIGSSADAPGIREAGEALLIKSVLIDGSRERIRNLNRSE